MKIICSLVFIIFSFNLYAQDIISVGVISYFPRDYGSIILSKLAYENFINANKKVNFKIKLHFINNSWSNDKIKSAFDIALQDNKYLIFAITSTNFLKIYDEIKKKNILAFASGPTTTLISGINDNVIRNIPDVQFEQKEIADYLNKHNIKKILILKEIGENHHYINDAFINFKKYFHGKIKVVNFFLKNLNLEGENYLKLKKIIKKYEYCYILSGGASRENAILSKFLYNSSKHIKILLTPWIDYNVLYKIAPNAINSIYIPTYFPNNKNFKLLQKQIYKKIGKIPQYLTPYLCYEEIMILCEALKNSNNIDPKQIKEYIINHSFDTIFGKRKFNRYGDTYIPLKIEKATNVIFQK